MMHLEKISERDIPGIDLPTGISAGTSLTAASGSKTSLIYSTLVLLHVPVLTGQDAFKLVQPGSEWYVWVYRDY